MNKKNVFFYILTKNVENGWKKELQPAFGCTQHPKAGQNSQQPMFCHFVEQQYQQLFCREDYRSKKCNKQGQSWRPIEETKPENDNRTELHRVRSQKKPIKINILFPNQWLT